MVRNPREVLKAGHATGKERCPICDDPVVPKGQRVVVVEVVVGASFIKALQKTVRHEAHLECALKVQVALVDAIHDAGGL